MKSEKQKEPVYHFLESPYFQSSVQRLDHIMRDRKDICSQRIGGGGAKEEQSRLQNTYIYS